MPRWHTSSLPSTLILVATLSGCGGDSTDSARAASESAIDPRFASADALIAYYNKLTYEAELIDLRAVLELYYPENDLQSQMVRILKLLIPVHDLGAAMWEQFDEGMNPDTRISPVAPHREATVLTERNGERVLAREVDAEGETNTLHLVQIGDRWWLSGYTLEYGDDFTRSVAEDRMNLVEQTFRDLGPIASSFAPRVRRGEFSSAKQARDAFFAARIAHEQRPGS